MGEYTFEEQMRDAWEQIKKEHGIKSAEELYQKLKDSGELEKCRVSIDEFFKKLNWDRK